MLYFEGTTTELNIEQAFERYLSDAQHRRKVPSLRHFLGESLERVQKVSMGYNFFDQLRLLGMAVLQSVPNAIRSRYSAVNLMINNGTENLCRKLVIKVNGVAYTVRDYEGFRILNPEFEGFMSDWLQPKNGEVFVDIGSHIGKYAIVTSKTVGDKGFVVAIEPHPSNFRTLKKNIKLNNLDNIVAFNLAAWNEKTMLRFHAGATLATSNINRYDYGCGDLTVRAERMDKLLIDDLRLSRVDWIKIDVEGAEYEVLLGLEEILCLFKPKLIVEIWLKNLAKVRALLKRHGYSFVKLSKFGEAQSEYCVEVMCAPNYPKS